MRWLTTLVTGVEIAFADQTPISAPLLPVPQPNLSRRKSVRPRAEKPEQVICPVWEHRCGCDRLPYISSFDLVGGGLANLYVVDVAHAAKRADQTCIPWVTLHRCNLAGARMLVGHWPALSGQIVLLVAL